MLSVAAPTAHMLAQSPHAPPARTTHHRFHSTHDGSRPRHARLHNALARAQRCALAGRLAHYIALYVSLYQPHNQSLHVSAATRIQSSVALVNPVPSSLLDFLPICAPSSSTHNMPSPPLPSLHCHPSTATPLRLSGSPTQCAGPRSALGHDVIVVDGGCDDVTFIKR